METTPLRARLVSLSRDRENTARGSGCVLPKVGAAVTVTKPVFSVTLPHAAYPHPLTLTSQDVKTTLE